MLLLHQIGSVKVGEVVRYHVTYTPSLDRILPPPTHLHVKIRNTSSIPLRAAYLHGPYTLYVASYPSTFDPNKKHTTASEEGEPEYEPQLKAGGSWSSQLTVPEFVRQGAGLGEHKEGQTRKSFTWIIEIASQVLFSTTAAVHYELLVGRDAKSVSLTFGGVVSGHGLPGRLEDFREPRAKANAPARGVFTKAVKLKMLDTSMLWSTPAFPSFNDDDDNKDISATDSQPSPQRKASDTKADRTTSRDPPKKRRKKIHLVIITHGLHSNLGADMLYMKESIDATAKQARADAKRAKADAAKDKANQENDFGRSALDQRSRSAPTLNLTNTQSQSQEDSSTDEILADDDADGGDSDDEQVLVRGFSGNAVRTERGIQYLGKRLAKYVLSLTYPDQPYLPVKSSITQTISRTFTNTPKPTQSDGKRPAHKNSSIAKDTQVDVSDLAYQISSISFIGHSLGGLVQTYAIAYIQKHSPEFFDRIKPVNFIALASPFLGLSNENPMYVKFALDFGLVGRTGQDLGLTWRAPTIAKNGWGAMVGPFTNSDNKDKAQEPGTKPLLRILPTGPAHVALKRFRNRSVYSNVVNDGIVPLRTSCLLFLDWRGLGRVEKAQRESGLVGTMVNWGLNELTGQNASAPRRGFLDDFFTDSGDEVSKHQRKSSRDHGSTVPQADVSTGLDEIQHVTSRQGTMKQTSTDEMASPTDTSTNFWSTLTSFFRPQAGSHKEKELKPKQQKAFRRGQTMTPDSMSVKSQSTIETEPVVSGASSPSNHRKLLVRGSSLYTNSSETENLEAPPRTTVFESAGDLLNPPLPPKDFLLDPESRPRTIFHDRVYHPEDIPPPAAKRQRTFLRSRPSTSDESSVPNQSNSDMSRVGSIKATEEGGMRIEEKIARAYHKDLAWRKVLVRLEPDAHNNIIVRRMFANAYGWPVIKHMCDTHFAYTATAKTRDEDEAPIERARAQDNPVGKDGEEVQNQTSPPLQDEAADLRKTKTMSSSADLPDKADREVETLHLRHKNIQALKDAEERKNRSHRSPSEARESTDQVSDLISLISAQGQPSQSFSSMHSGTAALHRLSRQDSARWSDRYFDSEDEDDDETELDAELQRAYDRGGEHAPDAMSGRGKGGARMLSRQSDDAMSPTVISDKTKISTEPEQISRRSSQDPVAVQDVDAQTLSLTGIGLGKEIRDAIPQDGATSPDEGISEQVARARGNSGTNTKRPDLGQTKQSVD